MTTYTDRMHLAKPEPSDPESVVPINNNMRIIDDLMNMVIGLPANLSAAPNGQLLYDEALDAICLKAHGELIYLSAKNKPLGKKAYTEVTANSSTFINSELITTLQATFTAEAARKYVVQAVYPLKWVSGSSGPSMSFLSRFRWVAGPSIDGSSAIWSESNTVHFGPIGSYTTFSKTFEFVPAVDGQVTIGLGVFASSALQVGQMNAGTTNAKATILVRDYGA